MNEQDKSSEQEMRDKILNLVKEYCDTYHREKPYKKGDRISYAARIYDHEEMVNLVDSALEFWLTAGRYTAAFERDFAKYLGVRYAWLIGKSLGIYGADLAAPWRACSAPWR